MKTAGQERLEMRREWFSYEHENARATAAYEAWKREIARREEHDYQRARAGLTRG